ncbi:tRNA (adenosine(37)-N6)-threonylcarbamoyltransferase complex dimerization subunit type 1 TsaB [Bacillus sp. DTU_2020_1000418_1_SI_GHA_SEK_038]|uniref:tRNA (adenosine(37)-N6)-threonylcarbamoyltransferase complex dimerization subunit type 1 TsaB n=1 Tax=Bacillus sp. DTU_2020_1000418_1_SI_GHA_SEK_038 TaxID=3077585 RepID=UPI0028ED5487|nr:tRNA (adenosine(37)-N6)-threonylcarbamoyltransferase complex dimerization subunit type 1 TsaB [Bacillus sp. DTU_2020_1000418_1_SI_GHA_SEK_038]WNS75946.1 tRNA (adenosine(37)-N6)-threonylcarbamoyltransferase complex dimerization subunit type 1 TsaB [Bacillus sp. DTU_2020_1000418_1_SI_GHA_SEK_038]
MKVLSIDTSNYTLGVALLDGDQVKGEYITNLKKNHSVRVMPAIEALLKDCDIKPADLSKIVVAKGPGSYTGIRIGVTIAKTLAWTLNIPLVGISSLEVSASTAGRYFEGAISPLFDARRGQIYTGLYQFVDGKIHTLQKDQLLLSTEWAAKLKELNQRILFIGNDLPLHQPILLELLEGQAVFAEITEQNPRPSELALLGRDKEGEDIHSFVPNYIRLAEAETNWLNANKEKK